MLENIYAMEQPVRVRFAPSPTGSLHIGGIRTALYNYLFAKKHDGKLILRIEDTDQTRFVPEAEQYILSSLQWLGIHPDEGIAQGGMHAPYRQSERKLIYQSYAMQLVEAGHAYYAFDTSAALDSMRERLQAAKVVSPQYNIISREWMSNSLTLPVEEVDARLQRGDPYVIRFKMPHKQHVLFYDQVRGWVKVDTCTLDDKVLLKSDGMATYHLANVVDDYLMQISHVIRGEEWLPSAPLHVLLYKAFGWESVMPQWIHLPLLLKPVGHGKLSKRDADEHGFPIFPLSWIDPCTQHQTVGFREKGYLPATMINFLALLGWSPGSNQEIFNLEELIDAFSIAGIGKSGVKFNIQKANWLNHQHLLQQSNQALGAYLIHALDTSSIPYTQTQIEEVADLVKERAYFPQDIVEQGKVFFEPPDTYQNPSIQEKITAGVHTLLAELVTMLASLDNFQASVIKEAIMHVLQGKSITLGEIMFAIRIALFDKPTGPDLMRSMEILGKAQTIQRIKKALQVIVPIG